MANRFMYWPPTKVTQPWKPALFRGSDEYGNPSIVIGGPFTGLFILFYSRRLSNELKVGDLG